MTPRQRKELDPKSTDFATRFAIHLRGLFDKRKFSTATFLDELRAGGLDVSDVTVNAWLSGTRLPRVGDLEHIGRVLRIPDYRNVLPKPLDR